MVKLTNTSDLEISLKINSTEHTYTLEPRSSVIMTLNPETLNLEVIVPNFIVNKDTYLKTSIKITK